MNSTPTEILELDQGGRPQMSVEQKVHLERELRRLLNRNKRRTGDKSEGCRKLAIELRERGINVGKEYVRRFLK
jgi:hypothetical protein